MLNVLLQPVTYKGSIGLGDEMRKGVTNVGSCLLYLMFGES
jgi:hypothetical protein